MGIRNRCIQYALDKPGVLTVLPGVRNEDDLHRILGFLNAVPEERDYSILGTFTPHDAAGICVYCNHCQPCPAGLDVGLINKYYDLAQAGDTLARDHYIHLEKTASDCIACGHCDSRCPFHVGQVRDVYKRQPNVDRLCSMAEVAGGRTPATPRPIKPPLNPMTKR